MQLNSKSENNEQNSDEKNNEFESLNSSKFILYKKKYK